MNITPTTIKELVHGGLLNAAAYADVCTATIGYQDSEGFWRCRTGLLDAIKVANIFNAVLAAKIRKELASVPASDLPMPDGFPEMSQKDFSVQMRIVALEARIRELELRSTSDD